jgi:hypothetical protein
MKSFSPVKARGFGEFTSALFFSFANQIMSKECARSRFDLSQSFLPRVTVFRIQGF